MVVLNSSCRDEIENYGKSKRENSGNTIRGASFLYVRLVLNA